MSAHKTDHFHLCLHFSSPTLISEFRVNLVLRWWIITWHHRTRKQSISFYGTPTMAVRGGSCGGAGSYWGFVFVSYVRLKAVKCITKIYIKEEGVIYKVDKKIFFKHRSSSDGDWQQNTANIFQHVKERARPEEQDH